jgi:predicted DNA-binding WGR domain protein
MVFLTRIDSAQQVQRFWLSMMTPTLLGGWSLVREWGRIGSPGTVQARSFDSEGEARRVERQGIRKRERHGYQPAPDVVSRWSAIMAAGRSIRAPKRRSRIKSKSQSYLESDRQGQFDFMNT